MFPSSEIIIVSNEGLNHTMAICESQGKLIMEAVDNVVIDSLIFMGCKEDSFRRISQQLTLTDTVVYGAENSTSALIFREK